MKRFELSSLVLIILVTVWVIGRPLQIAGRKLLSSEETTFEEVTTREPDIRVGVEKQSAKNKAKDYCRRELLGSNLDEPCFRLTLWVNDGNKRVTLWASDADLKDVLGALAEASGIRIRIHGDLREKLTVEYQDISLEECLRRISPNYFFVYEQKGDTCSLVAASIYKSREAESTSFAEGPVHKHIATLSYGKKPGEVGLLDVPEAQREGPQSFSVDEKGNLYICDTVNGRLQVISSDGKPVTQIPIEGYIADVAVDEEGNVLVLNESTGMLCQYDKRGNLKSEIPISPQLLSEKDILTTHGGVVYLKSRDQRGYKIALMERGRLVNGLLNKEPPKGMKGSRQLYYSVRKISDDIAELMVTKEDGESVKKIGVDIPRLASIAFLGEDNTGNIYLQIEQSRINDTGINLGVLKMDPEGNVINFINEIPNSYANWTARLLTINLKGEVYQMLPTEEAVELNMWKWKEAGIRNQSRQKNSKKKPFDEKR